MHRSHCLHRTTLELLADAGRRIADEQADCE